MSQLIPPRRVDEAAELGGARQHLAEGRLEEALGTCRAAIERGPGRMHRALWEALREQICGAVRERALALQEGGEAGAAARWLGLLAREDARAADSLHLHLARSRTEPSPADGSPSIVLGREPREPSAPRCGLLQADELGRLIVCDAPELTVSASLFGELERSVRLHFEPLSSLADGVRWRVTPIGGTATRDGVVLASEGAFVEDGQRLTVPADDGPAATIVFRSPDPSTASAWLEFERGFDCAGARGALLLVRGAAGRVQLGGRSYLEVSGLRRPVTLELEGERLRVACEDGLKVLRGADELARERASDSELHMAWPPVARIDLACGAALPPFWLSLSPAPGPVLTGSP